MKNNAPALRSTPMTPAQRALLDTLSKSRSTVGKPVSGPTKQVAINLAEKSMVTMNRERTHARIGDEGRGQLNALKEQEKKPARRRAGP